MTLSYSFDAIADGRTLDFDGKAVVLSPEANARYEKIIAECEAEKKTSKVKEFTNVDDLMDDLLA